MMKILLKVKVVFVIIMAYLKSKWIVHVYCQIIFFNTIGMQREKLSY